jgi:hypothetical protein
MPSTRTLDPSTSHAAEKSVSKLAESYGIILDLFRTYGPMNDEQLITRWKFNSSKYAADSGIRSRRSELVAAGRLEDSGDRIKMTSGRMSIVWRLVA